MTHSPGHAAGDRELACSICHDCVFASQHPCARAGLLARTLRWPLSGQGYTHAWLKWNHPEQSNLSSIPCLWSSEQGGMREVGIQADLLKEVTLLLL